MSEKETWFLDLKWQIQLLGMDSPLAKPLKWTVIKTNIQTNKKLWLKKQTNKQNTLLNPFPNETAETS